MIEYIKKPHTTIFIGPTGCSKTGLVLDLIEKEYYKHYHYIVIIWPTLPENNKTYHVRRRMWGGLKMMIKFGFVAIP